MSDNPMIQRKTVTDDGAGHTETVETTAPAMPAQTTQTLEKGVPHGDEEVGGAAGGAIGGAVVGTAVGGPVGTVVGGAIGAAAGATAGALDSKRKDEEVVVTKEEKTW
jgi:outer membrane lipoprotein SlyB